MSGDLLLFVALRHDRPRHIRILRDLENDLPVDVSVVEPRPSGTTLHCETGPAESIVRAILDVLSARELLERSVLAVRHGGGLEILHRGGASGPDPTLEGITTLPEPDPRGQLIVQFAARPDLDDPREAIYQAFVRVLGDPAAIDEPEICAPDRYNAYFRTDRPRDTFVLARRALAPFLAGDDLRAVYHEREASEPIWIHPPDATGELEPFPGNP